MDETPVYLDMPSSTTIAPTGALTVHTRRTHSESIRVSVLLSIAADGTKPMLIFRGAPEGRIATKEFTEPSRDPSDIVLACQKNAFNDQNNMHLWLDKV